MYRFPLLPRDVARLSYPPTALPRRMFILMLACTAILTLPPDAYGQGTTDTLAITGDPAPDGNGQLGTGFAGPVLNGVGQGAFYASLTGTSGGAGVDDYGVFRATAYSLTQIARRGQTAPDANGTFYGFGYPCPTVNDSGQVAWYSDLTGTTGGASAPDTHGIFRGSGGSITQIARGGWTVPGGNGTLATLGTPAMNSAGAVVFHADLAGTSNPGLDDEAIYRGSGGALTQITRIWDDAPDGNGKFYWLGDPTINVIGQAAFNAQCIVTAGGVDDEVGVFRSDGTVSIQIAREGQAAPDGNGEFDHFVTYLDKPSICDDGQVGFQAFLRNTSGGTTDNSGFYRGDGTMLTQIVREADASPDGNGYVDFFLTHRFNDAGQVAWHAFMTGTSGGTTDDQIVCRASNASDAIVIARRSDAAPDGNGTIGDFNNLNLSDTGIAAFESSLLGTSGGSSDNRAIYAGDGIDLVQVARKGESLEGSTIAYLGLLHYYDTRWAINDHGQVAYWAQLASGDAGQFRFTPTLHWRTAASGNWDTAGNWTLGVAPASVHDVVIDPVATLTVLGPASALTVDSLYVGGGSGVATLQLQPTGTITSANWQITIESNGVLSGEGTINAAIYNWGLISTTNVIATDVIINNGDIDLASLSHQLTGWMLINRGTVSGSGQIHAQFQGDPTSQVHVGSGEHLIFTGSGNTNDGQIDVIGGELEFTQALTNTRTFATGLITGHDAIMRFHGGLTNNASIALSFGTSDLFGDITNTPSGQIVISGASNVTFYDDVINNGELRTSSGSAAVFFGGVSGSGTFTGTGTNYFEGDLRPGSSAAQVAFAGSVVLGGSCTLEMELGGTALGEYDRLNVAGQLAYDGLLEVVLIDDYAPVVGHEFPVFTYGAKAGSFATIDTRDGGGVYGFSVELIPGSGVDTLRILEIALLGDFNGSGMANLLDINPFVLALTDLPAYRAAYPLVNLLLVDPDGNDNINLLDINPFVNIIVISGGATADAVPTPTSIGLIAMGALVLVRRRMT